MTDSFKITDGTTEFEVVYNSSTQANYKLMMGGSIGVPEPAVLLHQPDDSHAVPVRAYNPNRTVFLTMDIKGADWDDVLNQIAKLKRMVDGANSQAIRYWLDNRTVSRVRLDILLDGATNSTMIPVLWGTVDDSESYYSATAALNKRARGVVIALNVLPWGEGAAITLKNYISNPGVYVDDGTIASGWSDTSGTGTASINTTNYLVGTQSQKYVETATGTGLVAPSVTSSGAEMSGYAWVYVESGTITARLRNTTDGTTVDSVALTAGSSTGSDRSEVGAGGQTWYRVPLVGPVTTGKAHRVEFVAGAATTFNVDAVYLGLAAAIPSGWSSFRELDNRNDISDTNPTFNNWIDTWGLPGDLPALVNWTWGGASWVSWIGQAIDGKTKAAARIYWIEGEGMTGSPGANWSTTVDANRAGGHYEQFDGTTGAVTSGDISFVYGSAFAANALTSNDWRVFAIARSDKTASTIDMTLTIATDQNYELASTATFTAINTWEFLDLGLIMARDIYASEVANVNLLLKFAVTTPVSGDTIDIDSIMLIPADRAFMVSSFGSIESTATYINGNERYIAGADDSGRKENNVMGELWTVESGPITTRTIRAVTTTNATTHVLTVAQTVAIEATPRVRHLLGTL